MKHLLANPLKLQIEAEVSVSIIVRCILKPNVYTTVLLTTATV